MSRSHRDRALPSQIERSLCFHVALQNFCNTFWISDEKGQLWVRTYVRLEFSEHVTFQKSILNFFCFFLLNASPTYLWTLKNKRQPFNRSFEWSSLDKEVSVACQITSPYNKKIDCFLIWFKNQLSLLLNRDVIWKPSDTSLSKKLHAVCLLFWVAKLEYFFRPWPA